MKKVEDLIDFFTEAVWLANFPGIVKMVQKAKDKSEERQASRKIEPESKVLRKLRFE